MRIIAGEWRGRRLQAPKGREVRPTTDRVREAWMSIVAPLLPEAEVLDLFAGSGALGLEAVSRGAAHATLVERSRGALAALRSNIGVLGADSRVTVVEADVFRFLVSKQRARADLAFADPPYRSGLAARLVERFLADPFADWLGVEHALGEALPPVENADERRYGETLITLIPAPDA